jgi:hypothetical protein
MRHHLRHTASSPSTSVYPENPAEILRHLNREIQRRSHSTHCLNQRPVSMQQQTTRATRRRTCCYSLKSLKQCRQGLATYASLRF